MGMVNTLGLWKRFSSAEYKLPRHRIESNFSRSPKDARSENSWHSAVWAHCALGRQPGFSGIAGKADDYPSTI